MGWPKDMDGMDKRQSTGYFVRSHRFLLLGYRYSLFFVRLYTEYGNKIIKNTILVVW